MYIFEVTIVSAKNVEEMKFRIDAQLLNIVQIHQIFVVSVVWRQTLKVLKK